MHRCVQCTVQTNHISWYACTGKTTIFQTRTAEECQRWINVIDEIATQCKNEREQKENREMGLYRRYKKKARFVYNSKVVQFGTGAIILASYISAMAGS